MHTVVGGVFNLVDLIGELGELASGQAALVLQHVRGQDQLVAVGQVGVNEVVEQRPLQTGTHASVDPEARAGQLGAAVVVDEPQVGAEIHVVLGLKVEHSGLAPVAERLVVFLAAGKQVGVGEVGKTQHDVGLLDLNGLQLLVDLLGLVGHGLHLGEEGGNVLALLLVLRNELVHLVLLGLYGLGLGDESASLTVQSQNGLNVLTGVLALDLEARDDLLWVFSDILDIQHGDFPSLLYSM